MSYRSVTCQRCKDPVTRRKSKAVGDVALQPPTSAPTMQRQCKDTATCFSTITRKKKEAEEKKHAQNSL